MEKQLKLFDIQEKLKRKKSGKLYGIEILEKDKKKYTTYIRSSNLKDAKKLAIIQYNDAHGYDRENDIQFSKIKEMKEVKCRTKTSKTGNRFSSYDFRLAEKKCGCYFKPKAEMQRQEIIKNLNKTSENEKLIRLKWKERR